MNTYDFVHLVLLASGGTLQGRTKLQKSVYFAGALSGLLPELGYRPYYYGPYSGTVAASVNDLQGLGFLRQTSASVGAVDPNGFEVARYDYTLTSDGKQIALEKTEQYPNEWHQILSAIELLKSMPNTSGDYVKLSIAAKMLYLRSEKGEAKISELLEMMPKFGWSVSRDQLVEARNFLQSLNLIPSEEAS